MSVPILDAWLFWNTIKVQELKLLAWNKIKLLTWQGSMYSLKSTAMLRCFITMLHGKVFTWFHNLLLATKKKNILIAWCCICGATSTFLLSLHKAWRVCWFFYQKIQRLVTCDCFSKSLQAHLSPTHSLPQPFLTLHQHHGILLSVSGKAEENGEKTWTTQP